MKQFGSLSINWPYCSTETNRLYQGTSAIYIVRENCYTIHERFLIIDNEVYHLGASMKDLGKKLFAFSKLEMPAETILKMTVMEEVENRKLQK